MNTFFKTAAIAAFGWVCYKIGDFKGSICTGGFSYDDAPADVVDELAKTKHAPLRLNALMAKAVKKHNKELHEAADTKAPEEAD